MDQTNTLIRFSSLEWITPATGARYKEYIQDGQKIRLVEFSEGFVEEDWCTKGHIGYVLEGAMKIDFNGEIANYSKGDALWIEEGDKDKHKVLIGRGERVHLFLVEAL